MDTPMTFTVTAVDASTRQAVPGSVVIISNFSASQPHNRGGDPVTVTLDAPPFTTNITFHYGREVEPETNTTKYDLEPEIRVTAPEHVDGFASATFVAK